MFFTHLEFGFLGLEEPVFRGMLLGGKNLKSKRKKKGVSVWRERIQVRQDDLCLQMTNPMQSKDCVLTNSPAVALLACLSVSPEFFYLTHSHSLALTLAAFSLVVSLYFFALDSHSPLAVLVFGLFVSCP